MCRMRNSSLLGKITVFVVICCCSLPIHAKYGGGTGGPNDPYLIFDANQMNAIGADSNDWDKHFLLCADIDLSAFTGTAFNIIGTFTGTFDGNGHTISNFTYTSTGRSSIGLFGYVSGENAEIKDLGLINPNVDAGTSWYYVGSLVGYNSGTITGCYVEGGSVAGNYEVGGLVGIIWWDGTITDCYSTASVEGNNYVGGLVGYNSEGTISNCYASGDASGEGYVGGLVGWNTGWCGSFGCWFGTISNCYSTGSVSGDWRVGGLVGYNEMGDVTTSFWDIETSGQTTSAGGTGLTTAEMQTQSTFTDAGWDFNTPVWTIDEGVDYPRLWWEQKYGGGTGEPNDPYLIYDANQMNAIGADSNDWDKHFILMADIDLSGYTGTSFNIIGNFTGIFDGSGHTISNFTYTSTDTDNIGLFGYVGKWGENAEIKNLGLIDPNVGAGIAWEVGSLVGRLEDATITNCYVEGGSVSGDGYVGGLVGFTYIGTITNCYSTGSVSGNYSIGGLVGFNSYYGTITNCYSGGDVSGARNVGGLVGYNQSKIINCYSTGSVSGNYCVGGLVGSNSYGSITNCYSTGSVSGTQFVGGLVGNNHRYGTISNSYSTGSVGGNVLVGGLVGFDEEEGVTSSFWDTQTSGQTTSAGGMGKTTAQMQNPNTFMQAGWDFVGQPDGPSDIWAEPSGGGYPILWWQLSPLPELPFSGGTGDANDPYLISTADELNGIGHNPRLMAAHFKLINDIDLAGVDFFIIGNGSFPFIGVFDGSGHTISNFNYTSTGTASIGLFAYVEGGNAEIKNLGLLDPNVDAGLGDYVGSLVGSLGYAGTITNCYVEGGSVSGSGVVGGLVGGNCGTITNCYVEGGSVSGRDFVGGLVGENGCWDPLSFLRCSGTISNCYGSARVSGHRSVGGLVGGNYDHGTITNSYSTGTVSGDYNIGGLVGWNGRTITDCYSTGSITGTGNVGGLVGKNGACYNEIECWRGRITNCYSTGSVSGHYDVGGLVGRNGYGAITDCYSTGSVSGNSHVGGLVGTSFPDNVFNSFWDIETSGQSTSAGGTGLTTAEMQAESTFTSAGWDFTTPVWTIDEGVDYPRLWWELAPVLHTEPEITLGTSNTITWDPVPGANDYYAECAEDANFTSILSNTGWITETSCEFTGLEIGKRYWYSVKARNSAGVESQWSDVESSLQGTLADAVDAMLDPDTLKNKNMKKALLNKISAVQQMLDKGRYEEALNKLENDILQKTDGCAETGRPDKNDWIITCEEQGELYPLVIETIEHVTGLMNQ